MKKVREIVVGCDPSSKLLAATITFDRRSPMLWKRTLPEGEYAMRADWAERHVNQLLTKLSKANPDARIFFFVELPVVGAGARATIAQAIVLGGTMTGARRGGAAEIHEVNNQRWKKTVVGSGAAKKPQIKKYVRLTWPVLWDMLPPCRCKNTCTCGQQDLCDSACINAYGQSVLDLQKRIEDNKETI